MVLKNLPSMLGSAAFKERMRGRFFGLQISPEVPDSRELSPSADRIIASVSEYFNVTKEQLCTARRGRENLPRDVAIFLVRQHTKETLAEVGRHFGIEKYSTVSSTVERMKQRLKTDRRIAQQVSEIQNRCIESQGET